MLQIENLKAAVITFIFPIAEPYYRETIRSILKQSDQQFDLIVVDDGLKASDLPESARLILNSKSLNMIELRESIFNLLIDEGYDLLISIDSDDTMSEDRVRRVKEAFTEHSKYAFYYTPFYYLSDKKKHFFDLPDVVESQETLLKSNFIGLSHTSYNLKLLREDGVRFKFPDTIVALDWYIAVWMLISGYSGIKTRGKCFYRIYGQNLAGETSKFSLDRFKKHLNIKICHYQAICELLAEDPLIDEVKSELRRLNRLKTFNDPDLRNYLDILPIDKSNYWWTNI